MKKTGLAIFILCFSGFVALFWIGQFSLSERVIRKQIKDPVKAAFFSAAASDILDKSYHSQFYFIQDLNSVIDQANEMILIDRRVNEYELDGIIQLSTKTKNIQYNKEILQAVFDERSEAETLKLQEMEMATSWMFNKPYPNITELETDLIAKVVEVNRNIINAAGFAEDSRKALKLHLVKSSTTGFLKTNQVLIFWIIFILGSLAAVIHLIPQLFEGPPGIRNDGIFHHQMTNRGWLGIALGTFLIAFYILLYKFPEYISNWIYILDPLSKKLNGREADQWFMYGFLYSLAILVMGIRMLIKYRDDNYQKIRTLSVIFFQLCFAFSLPLLLRRLNLPAYDLKSIWPLEYTFFFDYRIEEHIQAGTLGIWMFVWGVALALIAVPLLTYFYGKRWYCSWVCGCGGLAETLGDPFRQLSDKSLKAWRIERVMVHGVLILALLMTSAVLYTYYTGRSDLYGISSYALRSNYGFMIGFIFSGVVGTGFYPLMGNRVWCRFGCPLAAYLGIVQRFKSRFRITTNGAQCISCGNCSTYCEMGIDVKWYAQRGQNIVRASCVGCGICSAVCPRGVLKLENSNEASRFNQPIELGNNGFEVRGQD